MVVSRYFGFLRSDKKQSSVHCKLYRVHVPTKTGNTSNLLYHLKQCHAAEYVLCKSVQTPSGARATQLTYDKISRRHRDLTVAITYCIANDMLPISTVEKNGFKSMLKAVEPR